jgi:maltose alpha-D-glucosyltransferase / alpha-amylase
MSLNMARAATTGGARQRTRVRKQKTHQERPQIGDRVWYMPYLSAFRDGHTQGLHVPLIDGTILEDAPCVQDGQGDLVGALQSRRYLAHMGFGGFLTGAVNLYAGTDGPYSPRDHFRVDPRFGDERILRSLTSEFRDAAATEVLGDMVVAHAYAGNGRDLSLANELFRRACQDPDGPPGQLFYIFHKEEEERYRTLRVVFPDENPMPYQPLPGHEDELRYVTRFYRDQAALRITSPQGHDLLWQIANHMLGTQGFGGLRADACMYWDCAPDTTGEHTRAALATARFLRDRVDANYPDRVLLAEAAGDREVVAQWLRGGRMHSAWDFQLQGLAFYAYATRDWRLVRELFRTTPRIDDDARWAVTLRQWDELQLAYQPPEVAELLYATLGVNSRYRINRGLKQRFADLVPDERAAIMLLALVLTIDAQPCIYPGDELLVRGDRDRDFRLAGRNAFAWDDTLPNAGFSDAPEIFQPLSPDWRYRNVARQIRVPSSPLERVRRLIRLRNGRISLQRGIQVDIPSSNPSVLAFGRIHNGTRSDQPLEDTICVFNVSPYRERAVLELQPWHTSPSFQVFRTDPRAYPAGTADPQWIDLPFAGRNPREVELEPYEYLIIRPSRPSGLRV